MLPSRNARQVALRRIFGGDHADSDADLMDNDGLSDNDDVESDDGDLEPCLETEDETSNDENSNSSTGERYDGAFFIDKNNEKWNRSPPAPGGRRAAHNVMVGTPGLTPHSRRIISSSTNDECIFQSFLAVMTIDMWETLVVSTNKEGHRTLGDEWKPVDMTEMQAFVGLLLARGTYKANGESTHELWSTEHGRPMFSATMSYNRFRTLRRFLRFDDKMTRASRLRTDKLAAIRLLLDRLIENSQACYIPGPSVTVDEQLYSYRGRCKYRQYMPKKPAKYGLKFWLCCDSETFYVYNLEMYTGKDDAADQTVSLGERVVRHLSSPLWGSGRNVTTDNFFTCIRLARFLHTKQMTLVGTMKANRREVPVEMKHKSDRNLHSSIFAFNEEDNTCLVSYKSKTNKTVIALSSQHASTEIVSSSKQKPAIIVYYNSTKGGCDAADQRIATYSVKYTSRRWHVVAFCNIVDISALNAYILFSLSDVEWNSNVSHRRRLFLLRLSEQLSHAYRSKRHEQHGIHPAARLAHSRLQNAGQDDCLLRTGRCAMCTRQRDRKVTTRCVNCQKFVCRDHFFIVCRECVNQ